jgi:hypothetical protein
MLYDQYFKPTVNIYVNGITFIGVEEIHVEEDGYRVFNESIEIAFIHNKDSEIIILDY